MNAKKVINEVVSDDLKLVASGEYEGDAQYWKWFTKPRQLVLTDEDRVLGGHWFDNDCFYAHESGPGFDHFIIFWLPGHVEVFEDPGEPDAGPEHDVLRKLDKVLRAANLCGFSQYNYGRLRRMSREAVDNLWGLYVTSMGPDAVL